MLYVANHKNMRAFYPVYLCDCMAVYKFPSLTEKNVNKVCCVQLNEWHQAVQFVGHAHKEASLSLSAIEMKRKEQTTPFGRVNLMRSPVLYRAAQDKH